MAFDSPVAVPPTSAYGPKDIDFSWLADLPNRFFQGQQNQFQQQQNRRTTALQQPVTQTNTQDVLNEVLKRGGAPYAEALLPFMLQQEQLKAAGQPDPMLQNLPGGGGQSPQSVPAPTSTLATVRGGDQGGSIVDLVTAKIPQETAGPTIAKIAQLVGVDPNATLTPGQQIRVNGLVARYAQTGAAPAGSPATSPAAVVQPTEPGQPPSGRVGDAFSALRPSAGNVSAPPQGQPAPAVARPQQPAPASPPAPQQQPLVPQVPLPQGFGPGQEQQAILALEREAALIAKTKPDQAAMLENWAKRIAASSAPVKVGPYESLVDPRTGQPIYKGAMAQMATNPETSATLDADAERYRQTGTLPPNMGRGIQGQQQATAIRTRAVQQEVDAGGDPGQWPNRWAQFKTQGGYPEQVKDWRDGIKSGDIPPVGIPAKIRGPVTAGLEEDKFNLSKAVIEWNRAQKQIQSLNGPQMTRFVGLADSVTNTIDEVNALAEQMKLSGIPLLNRAELSTYIQTQGNSENGQLAARYIGAVGTLKEEFANLANGGYAPTEPAWTLANRQINEDYGVKELGASLREVQRLIKYRMNAIPNLQTMGPGAGDRYTPGGGGPQNQQQPQAPAAGGNVVQWVRRPDGSLGPAQ